jgi:hypothetical protein
MPTRTIGVRPPTSGAYDRGAPDRLDYLMPDRPMQPRRGRSNLPRVRRPRRSACGRVRPFAQEGHAPTRVQNPSASARERCRGYGSVPWMFGASPLPRVVRAPGTAFRGRFASTAVEDVVLLRNDCRVARGGPTTAMHLRRCLLTLLRPDCPSDAARCSYLNGRHPRPVVGHGTVVWTLIQQDQR